MFENQPNKKIKFLYLLFSAIITFLVYINHFDNPFEFDDEHTIVNNEKIRDLSNIPDFFSDATTFSSLPANQAYRPGLTTLNAIDYTIGGELLPNPFYYHISIFITFIILGFLIYKVSIKVFENFFNSTITFWFSLFLTNWFWLHTANTACINYIIARSDSFSTMMVLLAFYIYLYFPKGHKYFVYMIPIIIGFFVKEPVVMFVPILFIYRFLFEEKLELKKENINSSKAFKILKTTIVPFTIIIFLYFFSRYMTPNNWTSGSTNRIGYLITQPFVILHYFENFILPVNLVIDSDWKIFENYFDYRVFVGLLFILILLFISYKASKNHKPITFGVLWFLLALLPTSSIFPLAEVLNDHRPFFPYIGLFIAFTYCFGWLYNTYNYKKTIVIVLPTLLCLHAFGTYNENKKWNSVETIWKEATLKAPKNGRAWMNYGNSLMAKGDLINAEIAYNETLKLYPNYANIHINLGILNGLNGKNDIAENYFKKALELDKNIPDCYSFYGRFLFNQQRIEESSKIVEEGLKVSSNSLILLELRDKLSKGIVITNTNKKDKSINGIDLMHEKVKKNPTPENYIDLSLEYYNAKEYEKCIEACNKALQLKPDYSLAYNNICSSYNELKMWQKAADAGQKGLAIEPNNELLKGNLNVALSNLKNK